MKTKLTTAVLLSVLSCILLTPMTAVSATKPVEMWVACYEIPGTTILIFEDLPSGLQKVTLYTEQVWTGDWEGTAKQGGTGMFRSADHGKAWIILGGHGEFTGTIQGKTGTVIYYMRNNISPEIEFFSARMTILGGTGELANIHGEGAVVDNVFLQLWVHFDPPS